MGSVRLTERVHPSDPPTGDDLRHVETLVVEQLDEVERIVPIGEGRTLVAVAGTATTLQACALGLERYDPDLDPSLDAHARRRSARSGSSPR